MAFHAAKDLVYTIGGDGTTISSGGYRISKILNGKSKKKGKQAQAQEGGEGGCADDESNIFNEDSGIPIGLLLLQRIHQYEPNHKQNKHVNATTINSNSTNNLVYASIMAEGDSGDDTNENIELVITPSGFGNTCESGYSGYSENPIEISSNQIDDDLYNSLIKSVSGLDSGSDSVTIINKIIPLRKTNTTKRQQQQRFGKHKDIEKIFQRKMTKSKRQRHRD
jgi:hypothetical protein